MTLVSLAWMSVINIFSENYPSEDHLKLYQIHLFKGRY